MNSTWKNVIRSWTQHTGTQVATLTILIATFTLVTCMFTLSSNMRRILYFWGESINITAYIKDNQEPEDIDRIKASMEALPQFKNIHFTSKEQAKSDFEKDFKAIMPGILDDEDIGNPFPASFQGSLKDHLMKSMSTNDLEALAEKISAIAGIDDVTYGQDWVKNYSTFLTVVTRFTYFLALILLGGSILVIGNSLRASLIHRREEIEILELIGTTPSSIRWPYVFEGGVMGFAGGTVSILITAVLYHIGTSSLQGHLSFMSLGSQLRFLEWYSVGLLLLTFTFFGVLGSYLTIRQVNTGYAAAKG